MGKYRSLLKEENNYIDETLENVVFLPEQITKNETEFEVISLRRSDLIIDLLKQIKDQQVLHNTEAATKADVSTSEHSIIDSLTQQNKELREYVLMLKRYMDLFSFRKISIVASLILTAISTFLVLFTILSGPISLSQPFPQLMLVFSIGIYFVSKYLPKKE